VQPSPPWSRIDDCNSFSPGRDRTTGGATTAAFPDVSPNTVSPDVSPNTVSPDTLPDTFPVCFVDFTNLSNIRCASLLSVGLCQSTHFIKGTIHWVWWLRMARLPQSKCFSFLVYSSVGNLYCKGLNSDINKFDTTRQVLEMRMNTLKSTMSTNPPSTPPATMQHRIHRNIFCTFLSNFKAMSSRHVSHTRSVPSSLPVKGNCLKTVARYEGHDKWSLPV
jgi:hypothetical protein